MIVVSIVVGMSKMYDDIGYRVTDMLRIIVPSLLFMGGGLYLSYTRYLVIFNWMNLLYKFGVLLAYLVFIYLTNRKSIKDLVRSGRIKQAIKLRFSAFLRKGAHYEGAQTID